MCWGLFTSTRAASRAAKPAAVLDLHRYLGALSVVFTAVHIGALVADSYVDFGWREVLVPFASEWRPGAVALGVVATYLLVAIELTSLAQRHLPRRVWLAFHRLSFPLYLLATVHGVEAGTDATNELFRLAMLASASVVAMLTMLAILAHRRVPEARRTAVRSSP